MRVTTTSYRVSRLLKPSHYKLVHPVRLISRPYVSRHFRVNVPFFSSRSYSSITASNTQAGDPYSHFFRYTSGRWLWDEEQQLRDRFTPFNVLELQQVAARSVNANCINMVKLEEGASNKVFRLAMDDGSTVIAKIPYPITRPKHYCTASEVATMDFICLRFYIFRRSSIVYLALPNIVGRLVPS
jgi:hypothetical protein